MCPAAHSVWERVMCIRLPNSRGHEWSCWWDCHWCSGTQTNTEFIQSFYTENDMFLTKCLNNLRFWQQVVDLLVSMCRSALESPRKVVIFEPYPSVVDPNDSQALAFNPRVLKTLRAFSFSLTHLFCVMLLFRKEYYNKCLGSSSEKGLWPSDESTWQYHIYQRNDPGIN